MMTLRLFSDGAATVPLAGTWLVGDLGVALGKQELFTRQSPEKLKVLGHVLWWRLPACPMPKPILWCGLPACSTGSP